MVDALKTLKMSFFIGLLKFLRENNNVDFNDNNNILENIKIYRVK